ncbi:DUF4252 domain-containing protein [Sinomicrobium sp. FJxs]|uniref:DUF4252 domain-containing protein n=2 Tax=Sinomicrobium weinanense TaxID=2842200 RepID=A0A926JNZ7_9FLAO|nr:DUF4252 domain-containing protein [Sinomicrobium weinanense]MBC9794820.1 DUF4252 domain-containing protein [Sinomicrobium weinanense]MBU3125079.1 DUF4252 domain-containing protein [Sinomicrobium weinanense]
MTARKLVICMLLAVLPALGFSQAVFDRFEAMDDVSAVIVNQNMFKLFSRIEADDPEAKEFMEMVKTLKNLKVFSTSNKNIAREMQSTMGQYIQSSSLEELMRVKDENSNVKFYIKPGKDEDHVSELLMFVSGLKDVEVHGTQVETVLLSLTGDIDLNKISMLTKKMNLPSELDEAGKKQ